MGQGPVGSSAIPVVLRCVDRGLAVAAMMLLLALLGSVSAGVITRAAGDPLIWTDEVSRFLMIWLAAVGWLLASRRRAHIRVRYFVDKLPGLPREVVERGLLMAVCAFGAMVAFYGFDLVTRNWDIEATTVPLSMSVMYAPVVLVGIGTALQALGELFSGLPAK